MSEFWIILTGSLVAVSCSLLGCYLVLRKMAMIGDAISHAVLPGIVVAFLFTRSLDSIALLIGAGAVGLGATFLIELFHKHAKLQSDAAIGITFTWLFALGVILIALYTGGDVDLDQECVLYGEIAYTPLDPLIINGVSYGPTAVWVMSGVLIVIAAFISFGYKELFLTTFDPALATALGISTAVWHYSLMGAVSITTVAAFESVGAILVVALLITPPATAYLLTDKLPHMLAISSICGILSAIGGYYLAVWIDGSIAGAMSAVAGFLFFLALLFSPSQGALTSRSRAVLPNAQNS